MQRIVFSCLILFCLYAHISCGTVNLATLTALQGLTMQQFTAMGANFASSIASCDFNGDGVKDAIIGAPGALSGAGAVIIIYGGSNFATLDLSDPAASGSGIILSASGQTGFGTKVSCLGNADANAATEEIIVGEGTQNNLWAVFGQSGLISNRDISTLTTCRIYSSGGNKFVDAIGIGDFNGDGKNDAVISVFTGGDYSGFVITAFSTTTFNTDLNVGWLSGVYGAQTVPLTFARAGKFNGDAFSDFIVGNLKGTLVDKVAVVFGTSSAISGEITLPSYTYASTPPVIKIQGAASYSFGSVGSVGDIDGDSFDDIIIGAPGYSSNNGAAFVVRGASTFGAAPDLTTFPSSQGFVIQHGTMTGLYLGTTVFGNLRSGSTSISAICDASASCYWIFGQGNLNVDSMNGEQGFKLTIAGAINIALIGEVNADGYADYLISQPSTSKVYVLYGLNKCNNYACESCTSPTICTSCKSAYPYVISQNCYATCPSHSYADTGSTCATCHANCLDCIGPAANQCSSCNSGGSLPLFYMGVCYAIGSCPSHTYQNSPNSCAICDSTCLECTTSGTSACRSCDSGGSFPLFYNNACYAIGSCPTHTYQNSATTCAICDNSCLECTGPGSSDCSSCDSLSTPPLLYNGVCYGIGACPSHSYQNSPSSCATCDSTCLECTASGPNACTSCDSGGSFPLFYNNACYAIGSCPTHTYQNSPNSCATCNNQCLECSTTASTCTSCDSGGASPLFYSSACYATGSCPIHSYQDSPSTCAICDSTCLECTNSGPNACSSCDSGGSFPLFYNNACYATGSCLSQSYQASSTTCADCNIPCLECSTTANTCTSCDPGSAYPLFYNNNCYDSCPSNSYQDSSTTCAVCYDSCLDCSGSATTCTSCDQKGKFPWFYNSACYSACPSAAPYSYSYDCFSKCPDNMVADSDFICIAGVPKAVQRLSSANEARQVLNEFMSTISGFALSGPHSMRSQSTQGQMSYYAFLNVDYPSNYEQFSKSNFNSSTKPNPLKNNGKGTGGGGTCPVNEYLEDQSLLGNIGYTVLLLIGCVLLIPITDSLLAILQAHGENCHNKWYHKLLKKSSVSLRWSFLINQFISKYQDLAFFSFLGVSNAMKGNGDTLNTAVCIFGIFLTMSGLTGVFFLIKILTKRLESVSEEEKEKEDYSKDDFLSRRLVLYKDLKKDEFIAMLYPFFLMLRVVIFCFITVFFCDQTALQLVYLNLYAIFMLVYIVKYQPLDEKDQQWMTLAYEIDAFIALLGVTLLAIYNATGGTDDNTKSVFGYMIIIANTATLVLDPISFFIEIVKALAKVWEKLKPMYQKWKNKSKTKSLEPIHEKLEILPQKEQAKPELAQDKKDMTEELRRLSKNVQKWKNSEAESEIEPITFTSLQRLFFKKTELALQPRAKRRAIETLLPMPNLNDETRSPSYLSENGGFLNDRTSFVQLDNSLGLRSSPSPSPKKRFTRTNLIFPFGETSPKSGV